MTKKISVIVNFHNSEKYIKECINSILCQTYENLEIILWDNCSDDKSIEIVKGFKDNRIKYFYNNKKDSLYNARNKAIKASSGELIAFLDSDDWWEENYLSSRQESFNNEKYDYFYSNTNLVFDKKKLKKKLYRNRNLPSGKIYEDLSKDYFIIISGVIFRKNLFIKFGNFNEKFNIIGDYDFLMKIAEHSIAHALNLPLINYRVHYNNYSSLNKKMFYLEYKEWFNSNLLKKDNKSFQKYINYFQKKLTSLEISFLLNEKKSLNLLKKILYHNDFVEKIKFLILFLIPQRYYNFLKKIF